MTISGADISMQGNGGNDFIGYGAAVMSGDDAILTVEDSYIATQGAAVEPCLPAATVSCM